MERRTHVPGRDLRKTLAQKREPKAGVAIARTLANHEHSSRRDARREPLQRVQVGVAIGTGTYIGGWRVIRTMGTRITPIEPARRSACAGAGSRTSLRASASSWP